MKFLPRRLFFAAKRYRRWQRLNPDATPVARARTLQELWTTYGLDRLRGNYPETRVRFFRETVFGEAPEDLARGLEEIISKLRSGALASLRIVGDLKAVPESLGSLVFRVLQESLANVSRHASAGEVGVTVEVEGETLALAVSDDGVGFDAGEVESGSGTGLRGIQERVSFAGGSLELTTAPGEGAVLECRFPLGKGA